MWSVLADRCRSLDIFGIFEENLCRSAAEIAVCNKIVPSFMEKKTVGRPE